MPQPPNPSSPQPPGFVNVPLAVLNADDPLVLPMAARTTARVLTFGLGVEADVRAEDISPDRGRASFTLVIGDHKEPVVLDLIGSHHVSNALASAAVAHGLGMGVPEIAAALTRARRRSPGRMEMLERHDGVTVVNDAYNANPDSVMAAFDAVDAFAGDRRRVLVMGEMAELGETSLAEHERIGGEAARRGIGLIVGFGGAPAQAMLAGALQASRELAVPPNLDLVKSIPEALELLRGQLRRGDVVLVKASKSVGLQVLARELASR